MFHSTHSTQTTHSSHKSLFLTLLLALCLTAMPSFASDPEENDPDPGLTQPTSTELAEQAARDAMICMETSQKNNDPEQWRLCARQWERARAVLNAAE